ncbi:MAG: DUF2269 family protein [Candidatus Dormibacteraeota bacterium]|nr:DUF2269 family protein [Candidatus Dormibacteraeota bacterium]
MNWFLLWLLLHIAAAIIAFGPTFVFPLVGSLVQKNPQAMHFAMELNHLIETRLVLPVALTMLVSGSGLIITAHINLLATTYLLVAIVLYLMAIGVAVLNQLPATSKLIQLSAAGPPPGAAPGPPPPEVMAQINRARIGGIILTLLLLTIIFLMVIKPGGIVGGPIFG